MSRGNAKQDIFLSDDDRLDFIEKLAEVFSEFAWGCYAYCLMDTHYHLLVETRQANLSDGMHELNSYYCKRFNWKHGKVGHVLQERFNSPLIEKVEHLHAVIRYIPMNPVKEGLVSEPGQWRWSSYRAISGLDPTPDFLDVDYTLRIFSDDIETARKAYMRSVAEGLLQDHTGRLTLQENFQVAFGKNERNDAICLAYFEHDYTMTEIAAHLKIHRATVSRVISSRTSS